MSTSKLILPEFGGSGNVLKEISEPAGTKLALALNSFLVGWLPALLSDSKTRPNMLLHILDLPGSIFGKFKPSFSRPKMLPLCHKTIHQLKQK